MLDTSTPALPAPVAAGARRRRGAVVVGGVTALAVLGAAVFVISGREAGPRAAARDGAPPAVPTASASPTSPPSTPTVALTPTAAAGLVHQVQPGESLSMIAERYGTTVEALVAYNNLTNPSYLEVGQRIRIPPARAGGAP